MVGVRCHNSDKFALRDLLKTVIQVAEDDLVNYIRRPLLQQCRITPKFDTVPDTLPGSTWLILSGLGGIGWLARKRRPT